MLAVNNMQIHSTDKIAGVPILDVRKLLRNVDNESEWGTEFVVRLLKITPEKANDLLQELHKENYIESGRVDNGQQHWRKTFKGNSLGLASAAPSINRKTAERHFKSWNDAVKKAGLEISTRPSNTSSEKLLKDLRRVAQELNKQYISLREYSKHGKHSTQSFYKKIGSWVAALKKAGLQEPKRKWGKPIKDIVLSEVRLNKIKIALKALYPEDLPSLYKCQEHLSFRGHIIENTEVGDIARILRCSKTTVLRYVRHVIDKIKILYEIQPDNIYCYNYQRYLYKQTELILSDSNKVALLKNKGIIYMWQLMTVKLSELDLGKNELLSLCNYLIREQINQKECKEILKHESKYYKNRISRGAGYDGLVYASFGQCPLERVDYKGLQEVISNFTYQQKIVIEEIFFNNKTLQEVGNIMNLTRERVRQIKVETLRKIRHHKWKKYYLS